MIQITKQKIKNISILAFAFFLTSQMFITADFALAGIFPIFNNEPQDLAALELKNRTKGDTIWQKSITAEPGDKIAFDVYYRNTVTGTIAENTKVKIVFPTSKQNHIVPTVYLSADNATTIIDTASISISAAEKLTFNSTALWYPDQSSVGQPISVSITSNSVEADIGDIGACWEHQGYVVFEAVLSKTEAVLPNLFINKSAMNVSQGQTSWYNSVEAKPSEKIAFRIKVNSTGNTAAEDVFVRDTLPSTITYLGNLKIDGISSSGNIISGINIGDIPQNQNKTVTFDARVYSEDNFSYGITNLINRVKVFAKDVSQKEDVAYVKVERTNPPVNIDFSVKKSVKNLSNNHKLWHNWVGAKPLDKVAFRIKINSTGDTVAKDVFVKDTLPSKITYLGNLKIDNISSSGNIISGINIGDLLVGQVKTITFDARVYAENSFDYGQTKLINTALAYNTNISRSDTTTVEVKKSAVAGVATEVETGIADTILNSILPPLLIALLLIFIFRTYFFKLDEWFQKKVGEKREYLARRGLEKYRKAHIKELVQLKK